MSDDNKIPALLRRDVVATPIPFAEEAKIDFSGLVPPANLAPAVHTPASEAAKWHALQAEAARLKAATGLDFAVGNAVCEACTHTFGAVAPAGDSVLPCPKCHTHRARWKYGFVRPGKHWACLCGNINFRVSEHGMYCPQCGLDQEGLTITAKG